jgi:hypothetical protein
MEWSSQRKQLFGMSVMKPSFRHADIRGFPASLIIAQYHHKGDVDRDG